jgi:hypothetical protein
MPALRSSRQGHPAHPRSTGAPRTSAAAARQPRGPRARRRGLGGHADRASDHRRLRRRGGGRRGARAAEAVPRFASPRVAGRAATMERAAEGAVRARTGRARRGGGARRGRALARGESHRGVGRHLVLSSRPSARGAHGALWPGPVRFPLTLPATATQVGTWLDGEQEALADAVAQVVCSRFEFICHCVASSDCVGVASRDSIADDVPAGVLVELSRPPRPGPPSSASSRVVAGPCRPPLGASSPSSPTAAHRGTEASRRGRIAASHRLHEQLPSAGSSGTDRRRCAAVPCWMRVRRQ